MAEIINIGDGKRIIEKRKLKKTGTDYNKDEIEFFPIEGNRDRYERFIARNVVVTKEVAKCSHKKYVVNKKKIVGMIIGISAAALAAGIFANSLSKDKTISSNNISITYEENNINNNDDFDNVIETNISELSSLDLVLVNDGVSDIQIEGLSNELTNDGLEVEVRDINSLDVSDVETYVALTSYKGKVPKIIGNYNSGNTNSDLLALGLVSSFNEADVIGSGIQRGVYSVSEDNTKLVPSDIENVVSNAPTVTIAVPEGEQLDANKFLDGLSRYDYYLNNYSIKNNYLLRLNLNDGLSDELKSINNLPYDKTVPYEAIYLKQLLPSCFNPETKVVVNKANVDSKNLD